MWEAEGTCHTGVALHPCLSPPGAASGIAPFKGSTAPGKSALQIVSILCSPWFCLCLCLVDIVTLQLVKICLVSQPLPLLPTEISDFVWQVSGSAVTQWRCLCQILLQDWGLDPVLLMVSSYTGPGHAKSKGSPAVQRLHVPGVQSQRGPAEIKSEKQPVPGWHLHTFYHRRNVY